MQRLKSRAQFQAVLAGSTVARTPHFALHQLGLPVVVAQPRQAAASAVVVALPELAVAEPHPPKRAAPELFPTQGMWLGAMVPKRWARRAVTRNTIKRQVYAVADGFEPTLPQAAYVLRLRAAFDKKQFVSATSELLKQAVRSELQLLLTRASAPKAAGGGTVPARKITAAAPAQPVATPAPGEAAA